MMPYEVEWTDAAREDLEAIADDIVAVDGPINALKVVEHLEERAESLTTFPMRGRVVPELRWHGVMSYRELVEKPWRLVYRIEAQRVLVVSALDGRRRLEDLLLDRFVR